MFFRTRSSRTRSFRTRSSRTRTSRARSSHNDAIYLARLARDVFSAVIRWDIIQCIFQRGQNLRLNFFQLHFVLGASKLQRNQRETLQHILHRPLLTQGKSGHVGGEIAL